MRLTSHVRFWSRAEGVTPPLRQRPTQSLHTCQSGGVRMDVKSMEEGNMCVPLASEVCAHRPFNERHSLRAEAHSGSRMESNGMARKVCPRPATFFLRHRQGGKSCDCGDGCDGRGRTCGHGRG